MLRWLVIATAFVLALGSSDARAQVFKPRGTSKTSAKAASAKKAAVEKADKPDKTEKADKPVASRKAKSAPSSRKVTTKGSAKSRASKDKGRPDDLTPDPKRDGEDVVIVVDEDED